MLLPGSARVRELSIFLATIARTIVIIVVPVLSVILINDGCLSAWYAPACTAASLITVYTGSYSGSHAGMGRIST